MVAVLGCWCLAIAKHLCETKKGQSGGQREGKFGRLSSVEAAGRGPWAWNLTSVSFGTASSHT